MFRPIMMGMLVTVQRRGLIEVFPEAVRKIWKTGQLRFLIISSLSMQIVLIWLGKSRKYNGKPILRCTIWLAYLLADWVATVALGVISNSIQARPNETAPLGDDLMSFWAPFLLLHLGGPDTITAYSLEDNQLWRRRVLELVTQTVLAVYIFLIAWPGISLLSLLSIPMLLAGLIKYCERIYSLRSANTEHFRLSLMMDPDPGPNYPKCMEEFTLKKAEGFYVMADEIYEAPLPTSVSNPNDNREVVLKAYAFFQTFKRLFVDLILSFQDRDDSRAYFQDLKSQSAFNVIEIELGFAFDVFYTKAPVVYSRTGCILRLTTFSLTLSSLLAFCFIPKRDHYHKIDLIITYLLMVVAIVLEICALLFMLSSDWTDYWFNKHHKESYNSLFKRLLYAPRKRWSNLVAQHSILKVCLEEKPSRFPSIRKHLLADNQMDEIKYITYCEVSPHLKEFIFQHFSKISHSGDQGGLTALCTSRGKHILENSGCNNMTWSISDVEFDQSILLWHIATELCYNLDAAQIKSQEWTESKRRWTESKSMSDYMLYLLCICPNMLPIGIGMIRFRDTCAEFREFFKERRGEPENPDIEEACKMLLRVNTEVAPGKVKGDRSKSVLFDACRLATRLRSKSQVDKWKIISQVWVEILAYAACHCRGTHHAQQLRKGGEFLTHVWLLMAHLGISEQFQISQGHARAKFRLK